MIHTSTAMTIRQNLGEILNGVQYRHDSVIITKANKPVAALVDIALFERIQRMKKQFNALSEELSQAFKDVDPEVGEPIINEAVKAAKGKK